jgi:hypothetical protein
VIHVLLPRREVADLLGPAFEALTTEGLLPVWTSPAGEASYAFPDVERALALVAEEHRRTHRRRVSHAGVATRMA